LLVGVPQTIPLQNNTVVVVSPGFGDSNLK
jgi:hypothetical protein